MSFYEDIARALDAAQIEYRVGSDCHVMVPITSGVEVQFVEIDPVVPAANVYIAAVDDATGEEFAPELVQVVFSPEDAVTTIERYITTDLVVTLIRDLMLGTDERLEGLVFTQDFEDPNILSAEVAETASLLVLIDDSGTEPEARVVFEVPSADADAEDSEWAVAMTSEVLELGTYSDFDRLLDVLELASEHAENWERELTGSARAMDDEPEVYDIFGLDDDDYDPELEDDDFDDGSEDDLDDADADDDDLHSADAGVEAQ
ncbi:hypothetical protein C1Y63_01760 [Corynebacterium sp. 13CS0277]|uniref:hypothetical protein n=1 Tax=Corynebacterium sp. 13CS0277 TaxID=2071994 RepID=UPI000D024CA9|nr:hypothetical protein [Corynebacterium sp. 13CS0277]PRQ12359.1 hypothetical protein C1Y63_01760 [Corynebacterium sp. 13CS0277]